MAAGRGGEGTTWLSCTAAVGSVQATWTYWSGSVATSRTAHSPTAGAWAPAVVVVVGSTTELGASSPAVVVVASRRSGEADGSGSSPPPFIRPTAAIAPKITSTAAAQ